VGTLSTGPSLVHVAFHPTGFVRSEPDYPVLLDGTFIHGADYLRVDPSGKHVRLEVSSLLRDSVSGGTFRMDYTGIIGLGGPAGKVLGDAPDAKTTDFGEACECPILLITYSPLFHVRCCGCEKKTLTEI
jgi:hypothetical protein